MMDWDPEIYFLPYALSCAISASIALYAWRRRKVPGAAAFGWIAFGEAFWTFGAILETLSPGLSEKIFWDGVQWLGTIPLITALPLFVAQYLDYKVRHPKRFWGLFTIVPVLFIILVLTSSFHGLVYPDPHLIPKKPYAALEYRFTPFVWAYSIYSYIIIFGCLLFLLNRFTRPHGLYRSQIAVITLGVAIPIIGTMLTLFGVEFEPQRDISPFTFGIGNLMIAWGLFRFHLFDIAPIARDAVVENLADPVIVLDPENRIIDLNLAALASITGSASSVMGKPVETVFSSWPDLLARFKDVKQTKAEITVVVDGREQHLEIGVSPLYNRGGRMMGRVFIVRDITEHIELEQSLQRLNTELEQRVSERTAELAQAYDTTLQGWAKALEFRDKETEGHSRRVTEMTMRLAGALDLQEDELVHIRRGALLHDIGKMAVPDEILRKGGELTTAEKEIVSQHPRIAYELLAPIPYLEKALEIPYCHHERWDGNGYPRGLQGEQIPLSARIFTIADVWDALQSDRPYRTAWSKEKTIQYMQEQAGTYFDPQVLRVFLKLVQQGKI